MSAGSSPAPATKTKIMFLLDITDFFSSLFEVGFIVISFIIGILITGMLLVSIFDGVQKRIYNNKKKWDDENKILRGWNLAHRLGMKSELWDVQPQSSNILDGCVGNEITFKYFLKYKIFTYICTVLWRNGIFEFCTYYINKKVINMGM